MSDIIKEAKKLCEMATPGPWSIIDARENKIIFDNAGTVAICYNSNAVANANFIAHARTLVPELVKEIEYLQSRLDKAEYAIALNNIKSGRPKIRWTI